MKNTLDDPQGYIQKLRPIYTELFRTAHAVVGNLELAEFVLKKAIYEAYLRRDEWRERMSFREALSQTVRMVALHELQSIRTVGTFDSDWILPPIPPDQLTQDQRQIQTRLSRESQTLHRVLMLYYGCGLRILQISQVTGAKPAQVREMLYMLRTRLERARARSGADTKKHAMEDSLEHLLVAMLQTPGQDVPDSGMIFRAFERDADAAPKPKRSAGRIIATALCVLGALLCAVMFWLISILMEPSSPKPAPDRTPNQQQSALSSNLHQESTLSKPYPI